MGCGRRKDIPSMKHMTDIWQPVLSAVQFNKFSLPILFTCTFEPHCDRSIIGSHIEPIANVRSHRAAFGPYAGINDDHMDRSFWEVRNRARQNISGLTNVLCLNDVAQI